MVFVMVMRVVVMMMLFGVVVMVVTVVFVVMFVVFVMAIRVNGNDNADGVRGGGDGDYGSGGVICGGGDGNNAVVI